MKNFFKNLALIALILAVASPVFAKKWKVNKDGTVDIELWYGAAVTEAGPPPADWAAYKIIKEKLFHQTNRIRTQRSTLQVLQTLFLTCSW